MNTISESNPILPFCSLASCETVGEMIDELCRQKNTTSKTALNESNLFHSNRKNMLSEIKRRILEQSHPICTAYQDLIGHPDNSILDYHKIGELKVKSEIAISSKKIIETLEWISSYKAAGYEFLAISVIALFIDHLNRNTSLYGKAPSIGVLRFLSAVSGVASFALAGLGYYLENSYDSTNLFLRLSSVRKEIANSLELVYKSNKTLSEERPVVLNEIKV